MQKFTVLFVLVMFSFCLAEKVTILGDADYKPYCYLEKGQAKGVYTDILNKAFSKLDEYEVEIKLVPWKRGLKMIEDGNELGLYPPYKHVEKRPYIWPYSEPILDEKVVVVGKEAKVAGKSSWPNDYFGMKVGVNSGFAIGGDEFSKAVEDGKITREDAKGNDANLKKLLSDRIDCYINDELSIFWTLKTLKDKGEIKDYSDLITSATVKVEQGYVGYSKSFSAPWKDDFIKKLDAVLKEMKESGEIDKIINSYK